MEAVSGADSQIEVADGDRIVLFVLENLILGIDKRVKSGTDNDMPNRALKNE